MPNIREYVSPVQGLQIDDRGVAARATAARAQGEGIAALGDGIGGAIGVAGDTFVKIKTQKEITKSVKEAAQIQAYATESWNKYANESDPNDDTIADKWLMEEAEPGWAEWVGQAETDAGRKFREQSVASMREHMFQKVAADMRARAGVAAVQNVQETIKILGNTTMADPTTMNANIGLAKAALKAYFDNATNIDPSTRAQTEANLARDIDKSLGVAAFTGMMRTNPAAAVEAMDAGWGANLLEADDREQLRNRAVSRREAEGADARAARAQALSEGKLQFERKLIALTPRMNDGGQLVYAPGTAQALETLKEDPYADLEKINAFQQAYQAAVKEDLGGVLIASDPVVRAAFTERISSTTNPLTDAEVYRARALGQLSAADFSLFTGAAAAPGAGGMTAAKKAGWSRVNDLKGRYKAIVTGSAGPLGMTPLGAARWAEFSNYVDTAYIGFTDQLGKSPEEATVQIMKDLDVIAQRYATMGPEAMRSTQNFMRGNPESGAVVNPTTQPAGPRTTHTYDGLTGGTAAAGQPRIKPGESAADYLKRVRGQQ